MMNGVLKFGAYVLFGINFALLSMEKQSLDVIVKIMTIPHIVQLRAIIESKQQLNQGSVYTNHQIKNALFSGYPLLLTCKKYYEIDREVFKKTSVDALYQFFPPGIALFLFPKNMQLRMKNKYYQDSTRNLIRAIVADNLFNNPDIIKKYARDINGNTVVAYSFFPEIKICTVLERVIRCIKNFMKNHNNYPLLNCIAVLDYLCLLKDTNLKLCGVNDCNKNLAQQIFDTFYLNNYQEPFLHCLSQKAQDLINKNRCVQEQYPDFILCQHKPIIKDLVATYLRVLSRFETVKKGIDKT